MKAKVELSLDDVIVFLLGALCVCLLSPGVAKTVGGAAILLLAALCLLLELRMLKTCNDYETKTLLLIVLYLFLFFAYKFFGISTSSFSHHMTTFRYFLPFVCILPIYKRLTKRQIMFLLLVTLITISANMLWNVHLKSIWGRRYSYQLSGSSGVRGVINTQYVTAIMFLSGALYCVFLHSKRPIVRGAFLIGVLLCVYFNLVVTQRAITLFLTVVMLVLLTSFNNQRHSRRRIILISIAFLIIFLVALEYEAILTWLASTISSARLRSRIYSIIRLANSDSISDAGAGSLTARLRLMGVSLHTIFSSVSNFLFGVGLMDTNTVVGNHSQLLDEFARFGFFGGLLSNWVLLRMLKTARGMSRTARASVLWGQFNVLIVVTFLRITIGTVFDPSISVVLYIITPLLFRLMQMKEEKA